MTVETFNSTTTWQSPFTGDIQIECWGGGGGGVDSEGNGGGGGAYARVAVFAVTATTVYGVEVGVAGSAPGGTGGQSWWDDGMACLADGAFGDVRGLATNSIGDVKYDGGDGGSSAMSGAGGGGGSSAGSGAAGDPGDPGSLGVGGAGGTAPTDGGNGGAGGDLAMNGVAGSAPGGGGGGGGSVGGLGAAGAAGRIRITYTLGGGDDGLLLLGDDGLGGVQPSSLGDIVNGYG